MADGHQELDRVFELVYRELRRLAQSSFRTERRDHTLSATALVNEVYLRLVREKHPDGLTRAQVFAVAARAMRQVLVDHARRKRARKRGGGEILLPFDEGKLSPGSERLDILSLNLVLGELARRDPRQASVVELRYFVGLTVEETAAALEISPATVDREWNVAKAWLRRELHRRNPVTR